MRRKALLLSLLLLFVPFALAQNRQEIKFKEKQADALYGYAANAYKKGFPRIAKRVYLMLLSEYDTNHAKARAALGYEKVGSSWGLRPDFTYEQNDKPDPKAAASLQKKWESLSKKIAGEHKKMARMYDEAGRADLARLHFEKVLFFKPDDEDAQKALDHKAVAGLSGTDLEQILYERSKKIERAVAEEARKDYPVEPLEASETQPFLENAKVTYTSVKSEHFTVRGDFEPELLMEAARMGERAVRVMLVTYEGYDGFRTDPQSWIRDWAFFKDPNTYKQILQANANLKTPENLKFCLEHTSASALQDPSKGIHLRVGAPSNEKGVYDASIRNVAQACSGFQAPALTEGIGHTIVGMFFNNNSTFIVDLKTQLETTTGEEDLSKFSPNMDTWGDLALEAAWKLGEGTPAAELPLITADKFPDDARIKSWSFCDYVVRRDPTLLLDLARLHNEGHPITVEEKFTEEHDGLSIAQLEKEWKDFWTEASPVLKAIRNNTEPLTAVSKDVKLWLDAFNKARKEIGSQTAVSWNESYSGRCRDHVEYLLLHEEERGPALEQMQNIELEGGSHLGDMFAQMALVCTNAKKPKAVFKSWLDLPGYRDALISNRLFAIGLFAQDDILVMDCIRGVGRPQEGQGGIIAYPTTGKPKSAPPTKIKVADLGPELQAHLEKLGLGEREVLGYPISLHNFGNGGLVGIRDTYKCKVTIGGKPVEGFLHFADGGSNRRTSAPGMVVFYPIEPLRKGVEVKVKWTFEYKDGSIRDKVADFKT